MDGVLVVVDDGIDVVVEDVPEPGIVTTVVVADGGSTTIGSATPVKRVVDHTASV